MVYRFKTDLCFFMMTGMWLFSSQIHAKPEGWLWYGPEIIRQEPKEHNHNKDFHESQKTSDLSPLKQLKKLRKNFEEATARAILRPTLTHIATVRRLQHEMVDRSSHFAALWQLAGLIKPETFDQKDYINTTSLNIIKEQENTQLEVNIKKAAKTHGLFFLVKKNCRFCNHFAPTVKHLVDAYGFEIQVIAKEEVVFEAFSVSVDNGIIDQLNRQGIYPALFLVSVKGEIMPLSWGLVSYAQLKENLNTVLKAIDTKEKKFSTNSSRMQHEGDTS